MTDRRTGAPAVAGSMSGAESDSFDFPGCEDIRGRYEATAVRG